MKNKSISKNQDFMHMANIAMDCSINQYIDDIPEGSITLDYVRMLTNNKDLEKDKSFEYYMDALLEANENNKSGQNNNGMPSNQSGNNDDDSSDTDNGGDNDSENEEEGSSNGNTGKSHEYGKDENDLGNELDSEGKKDTH
ncbi:hypothetical protein FPHOBKDP_00011 [Listeria phage LPJP1]|nr:hypothetical protein FPHOBKDP_00011 [Listeria phage LPJP1]